MKSNEEIISLLKDATNGMLLISEVDYPFEVFMWPGSSKISVSTENIHRLTKLSDDKAVEECDLEFLFRHVMVEKSWQNEEEILLTKRFQKLYGLLKSNLTDIKVFRLGRIEISVYIIGRTPSGELAGLSTQQFET